MRVVNYVFHGHPRWLQMLEPSIILWYRLETTRLQLHHYMCQLVRQNEITKFYVNDMEMHT